MSGSALALALGAAVLHAAWNLTLAGSRDTAAVTGGLLIWGAVLLAVPALLTGGVSTAALPFVAASAALELAYFALLARAYAGGSVSVVYPVSRGLAPALVLVVGVLGLGRGVSAPGALGVLAVCAGVLLIGRPQARAARRDLLFGLAIAADHRRLHAGRRRGRRARRPGRLPRAGHRSLRAPLPARRAPRTGPRRALRAHRGGHAGAYLLVLAALQRAPAAPVAAVRETSILLVTLFAAVFLKERVTAARATGAVLVVVGVALIAYS